MSTPAQNRGDLTRPPRESQLDKCRYCPEVRKRHRLEAIILLASMLVLLVISSRLWLEPEGKLKYLFLAGSAGTIAGLLHSLKWFYKSVARGYWEWDRVWWRFMNPIVSGVLGFSIYAVFRAGSFVAVSSVNNSLDRENFYAYGIGFLTGLFADNAMNKLRDIAHTVFGKTAEQSTEEKLDSTK